MRTHHLTPALLALAALSLGACGHGGAPATAPGAGRVLLSINGGPAMAAVTRVAVSAAPAGVTADLALDPATGAFTGTLSLPAGAQVVTARAFAGAVLVAEGSASVTVAGGETMSVAITVLDVTGPEPTPDHAPILTSLAASAATLEVGQSLTLDAAAVDVDGDAIDFTWSATPAGCATFSPEASTSDGAASTTATAALAGPCALAVEASAKGLADGLSTTVEILLPVVIDGTFVPQPVIGAVEFLAPATAAVLRSGADATVRRPWTTGVPVTVRVSWDATPWLDRSLASLTDSCGGAIASAATTATSETFTWTPDGGPVCVLTAALERQGLTDAFAVAAVVAPPAPACAWTEVAFHDLTTAPAGALLVDGAGGQGPTTVGGRTAWLQTGSAHNMLFVPIGLAAGDDVFAVEVDVRWPGASTFRHEALLDLFVSDVPSGDTFMSLGLLSALLEEPAGTVGHVWFNWDGTFYAGTPPTAMAYPPTDWRTHRVEGRRSTCQATARFGGTDLGPFSAAACTLTGPYVNLHAGTKDSQPVDIAWSNLRVFRGTAACVP